MEPAPVSVRFLPDQRRLGAVVKKIHATYRAYPLMELAALFLSNPSACYVRIECNASASAPELSRCRLCGMAAMEQETLVAHVTDQHLRDTFDVEETEAEPPAGAFTCVSRCGLTGELLGPPNHHTTAERIREIQRKRFGGMALAEYQQHVETLHDEALIEQWKERCRKQTVYRLKGDPSKTEPADGAPMSWNEAEAYMMKHVVPSVISPSRRTAMPAELARRIADRSLREAVSRAWQKESRFPLSLSSALRAAFRHRQLYVFKAGSGLTFVTAVRPMPLDMGHVVESLREALSFLSEHPGCTRAELVEGLLPGMAVDSDEGRAVLSPLSWLVEKGHIIEFFNGCLSVPIRAVPETDRKPGVAHHRHPPRKRKRTRPSAGANSANPGSAGATDAASDSYPRARRI